MEDTNDITKNFPKGDPFKVPEGFFEQFKEETCEKVRKQTLPPLMTGKWMRPLKIAASFALLVAFTYFIILFIQYAKNPVVSENGSVSDTLSYDYAFVDEFYTADALNDTTNDDGVEKDDYVEFLLDRNVSYDLLADYY